jgi:hypothetical protein
MSSIDPSLLASLQPLDEQSFVGKAYLALLGRPVDPGGFRNYLNKLKAGVPRAQICEELARSEEGRRHAARARGVPVIPQPRIASISDLLALDGEEFLELAYRTLLGREIDPTGLMDYSARLAAGVPKLQVVADIHSGPEGQARGAQLAGLKDALQGLRRAKEAISPASLADVLKLGDDHFLAAIYRLLLSRAPDPKESRIYSGLLQSGLSRMYVVREIVMTSRAAGAGVNSKAVQAALRVYEKANALTWSGWYLRNVKGVESDLASERNTRAIAYMVRASAKQTEAGGTA